jgi:hypothetical protein
MQKENQKTQQEVMPSVANFLSDVWFEGEFKNQPLYLQEIFELLLETESGNNLDLRLKNVKLYQNRQKSGKDFVAVFKYRNCKCVQHYSSCKNKPIKTQTPQIPICGVFFCIQIVLLKRKIF